MITKRNAGCGNLCDQISNVEWMSKEIKHALSISLSLSVFSAGEIKKQNDKSRSKGQCYFSDGDSRPFMRESVPGYGIIPYPFQFRRYTFIFIDAEYFTSRTRSDKTVDQSTREEK